MLSDYQMVFISHNSNMAVVLGTKQIYQSKCMTTLVGTYF